MNKGRIALGMLAGAGLSASARAQHLGGAASPDVSLVRIFLALLFCIVVAFLGILFVRHRLGGKLPFALPRIGGDGGRIRLLESRRISPTAELCLVACEERSYLLLLSTGGPLLLKEAPLDCAGQVGKGE